MARWQRKQRRTDTKRRLEPPRPIETPPRPAQQHRSSEPPASTSEPQTVVRKADVVVRLAYTPTQAAHALGVSRSSLYRFLPYLETIETPSGHPLIPVDELERLAAERRQAALARRPPTPPGRKPSVPPRVLARIRVARAGGRSYRQIAADLNASGTPTAQGGQRWWPSTVRAVLDRAARASAETSADGSPTYTDRAMAHTRTSELGPAARPIAVPEDLDDPSLPKARGLIKLPLHIRWSGRPITYDLDERADRARVYEQVLREGTEDDVRYYVNSDQLRDLWDELVVPPTVRRAWDGWFRRHRSAA